MFKFASSFLPHIVKMSKVSTGTNVIVRNFANYPDEGEYSFIHKYNYVANRGIYWSHPESNYIIRITDDYDQCIRGNQSNDDTCWWYFSKRALPLMMRDFNEQEVIGVKVELENWKLIKSAPKKYFEWSTGVCRTYGSMEGVSFEQKCFATKQFISTFYTDDIMEKLNSHPDFTSVSDELIKNLRMIWSDMFDQCTDMNQFRGQDNIPDVYIDNAIRALDIQTELGDLAKKLLKPKVYELYNLYCKDYLDGCLYERLLFHKHYPNKTYISEVEGNNARLSTVGFTWVLPANMTDESTAIHLHHQNPLCALASWICYSENDLLGYCKDKALDYSPMSFYRKLIESGMSELEAARSILNRLNGARHVFDNIWNIVPTPSSKHYEYLVRYSFSILDFSLVHDVRKGNCRYGWIPKLD